MEEEEEEKRQQEEDEERKELAALLQETAAIPPMYFRNWYGKKLQALSRRIKLLHPLADDLLELDQPTHPHLQPLLSALHHANLFLRSASASSASHASKIFLALDRDHFLKRHQQVLSHLVDSLAALSFDQLRISHEVREQVDLVHSQLKRALHQNSDTLSEDLHHHLLSIYNNPYQSNLDPQILHALANQLHLVTISDLKQESLAMHDMVVSTGGNDPDETIEKMSMLLKKIKDFVQTQNPVIDTVSTPKFLFPDANMNSPVSIPIPIPIPDEFRCPISLELMQDPVIVSTGQTYERICIEKWLASGHDTCPITQQRLAHRSLTTNYVLRSLITQWCEANGLDPPKRPSPPASLSSPRADLDALLVKLSSSDPEDQHSAAGEIRLLAKRNAANRLAIAQTGAVPLLKDLLFSSDLRTQEHAVTALLNLSICEENKTGIMASGCVPGVVHVLKTGNMEARENAAATLFSLSIVDEYKVTIGATGAIPALVSLLSEGTHRGKKDAATALFNLCIYQGNKGKAVRAGVVPLVMGLVTDPVGSMIDEAMAILAILASHPEGKMAIGTAEAVPVLVDTVRSGSSRNRENAAAVLVHLCNGEEGERFLGWADECGLLGPIRELAVNGTDRGKRKAVILLEKMSRFLVQKQEESSQETGAGRLGLGFGRGTGLVQELVEQLSQAHEDI
ncbi:U-box domain-containing protein [Rhynchospora pubera]|uniref:U-box domain-containing protein 12 n=1 Tax=Rhynchospora pubera TaxID=906938 RepID=A0AAV8EBM3_9POAL|nr:U-box domain-containing protein [Rhynchospora pubera]